MFFRSCKKRPELRRIRRDGLFAQNVFLCPNRIEGVSVVQRVRRA